MSNRFVTVAITSKTKATSQKGFGIPLILSTNGSKSFKEYSDLQAVSEDFDSATKEYKQANAILSQEPRPEKVAIYGVDYTSGTDDVTTLSDALNTLLVDHSDFYFLFCTENGSQEVQELSKWINSQKKMYFVTTDDETVYGNTLDSERTVVEVTKKEDEFLAEAKVGANAPYQPGSITWTFKQLQGISNAGFEDAEIDSIEDAGGNTYIQVGGELITSNSQTTSGEYIDIVRSKDWLDARITESVFSLLVNTKKVRFTNKGIAQVVSSVEAPIKRAVLAEMIATDDNGKSIYQVKAPKRDEISKNDRTNRKLPGVKASATLAGAVEDVNVEFAIEV